MKLIKKKKKVIQKVNYESTNSSVTISSHFKVNSNYDQFLNATRKSQWTQFFKQ